MLKFLLNNGFLPVPFMDGEGGGGSGGTGGTGGDGSGEGEKGGTGGTGGEGSGGDEGKGKKTFSQDEVNKLLAKEKDSGRRAILKEILGTDDIKTAKEGWDKYQQYLESQKTEQQKKDEALATEKKARADAENLLKATNNKLALLSAGAKTEYLDDLLILANAKVNDETKIEDVIKGLKTSHVMMFGEGSFEGTGTGGNPGKKKIPDKNDGLGKRLAEQKKIVQQVKNPYFTE